MPRPVIDYDIGVFIKIQLEDIRNSYQISQDWPGESIVKHLVDTSTPLFIYAATIRKLVNDPRRRFSPRIQVENFLSQGQSAKTTRGIATTYQPILEQPSADLDDFEQQDLLDQFVLIVGSVVLLAEPLSIPSLSPDYFTLIKMKLIMIWTAYNRF